LTYGPGMADERRYRFRCYPTVGQQRQLARTFGCARVVHNDAIALRRNLWRENQASVSYAVLDRTVVTDAKRTTARAWLSGVSTVALQQAVRDAHRSYENWWKGEQRHPRFKTRRGRQTFRLTKRGFRIRGVGDGSDDARVFLAKIGWVDVRWSRPLPSDPTSVTVVQEPDGRFYVSFVCKVEQRKPEPATSPGCGVDVGLNHLAVIVSVDGTVEKVNNPRHLRTAERKFARAQRSLSKKVGARKGEKASANYRKQRRRVAAMHRKVRDTRHDELRKLAHRLVHENQVVAVEQLNVKGLARTRMARSVHDASWATLRRFLEEAAGARPDRDVVAVDPRGTTRRCSTCGCDSGAKPLHVRAWTCTCCATFHDRDVNAAVNVMVAAGLANTENACGPDVRPTQPPAGDATGDEAGTHRSDHRTHAVAS